MPAISHSPLAASAMPATPVGRLRPMRAINWPTTTLAATKAVVIGARMAPACEAD